MANWSGMAFGALLACVLGASAWAQEAPAVPPEPTIPEELVAGHDWLERPQAADFERYYPPRALREEIRGGATLDCLVMEDGALTCVVFSESPPGYGFGAASVRVSRHFRMAPETSDGEPTNGMRVRVPIGFSLM